MGPDGRIAGGQGTAPALLLPGSHAARHRPAQATHPGL